MYLLPCILVLTLFAACSAGSVSSPKDSAPAMAKAGALASPKQGNDDIVVEALYSNYDYAFSVSVPQELVGCREPAPLPNHGFGVDLTEKSCRWTERAKDDIFPKSYLYVDASYNSFEWKSFDEAIESNISYLKKQRGISNVSVVQRTPTHLSRLSAMLYTIHYESSGEAMVEEILLAFRNERDTEIVYTIDLSAPASRYDGDRKVLAEMQKTWSLQPLP